MLDLGELIGSDVVAGNFGCGELSDLVELGCEHSSVETRVTVADDREQVLIGEAAGAADGISVQKVPRLGAPVQGVDLASHRVLQPQHGADRGTGRLGAPPVGAKVDLEDTTVWCPDLQRAKTAARRSTSTV